MPFMFALIKAINTENCSLMLDAVIASNRYAGDGENFVAEGGFGYPDREWHNTVEGNWLFMFGEDVGVEGLYGGR